MNKITDWDGARSRLKEKWPNLSDKVLVRSRNDNDNEVVARIAAAAKATESEVEEVIGVAAPDKFMQIIPEPPDPTNSGQVEKKEVPPKTAANEPSKEPKLPATTLKETPPPPKDNQHAHKK